MWILVDSYVLLMFYKKEGAAIMSVRITVLLEEAVDAQFTAFCQARGFKKSTLAARLIREHLAQEASPAEGPISRTTQELSARKRGSVQ